MEDHTYRDQYNHLISPRGTRERIKTNRKQFEAIIQFEKEKIGKTFENPNIK
jgi:hypothetical protein